MDIGDTIAPDSDQLDAIDLASSGPQTFTITKVVIKRGEQPMDVHLKEFPRPWRPGKNQRRVLERLWGPTAGGAYEGRRVTLFCDERVKFGAEATGGVRISHMSHIGDKEREVAGLPVSRGKFGTYKVKPLTDDASQGHASSGGITRDQEDRIREHMQRAKITPARVLELAQEVTGREIKKARELSSVEADALIVVLAEHVDPEEN